MSLSTDVNLHKFFIETPNFNNYDLFLYFDGSAQPNPGPAKYGLYVRSKTHVLHQHSENLGKATNNYAEIAGLFAALNWLEYNSGKALILGDSKLAIYSTCGLWRSKEPLAPFIYKCRQKLQFLDTHLTWIPRNLNKEADFLTR